MHRNIYFLSKQHLENRRTENLERVQFIALAEWQRCHNLFFLLTTRSKLEFESVQRNLKTRFLKKQIRMLGWVENYFVKGFGRFLDSNVASWVDHCLAHFSFSSFDWWPGLQIISVSKPSANPKIDKKVEEVLRALTGTVFFASGFPKWKSGSENNLAPRGGLRFFRSSQEMKNNMTLSWLAA